MTGKYSMMEKDTIDDNVVLDETKDIVQEVEREEEKVQYHRKKENSGQWIPGGSLGPFTVAEPVLPGTSTVIQCFTYRENQRDLMRFDPPWGLVFTQHNQTESGFVNYSVLKGKVDPANLPEVSCRTVASRGFAIDESTRGAAADASHRKQQRQQRNNQGRTGRMYAPELTPAKGIMNSSQLSFVLLVLSAGAYYLYSVHIVPKLAASRKSSTAAAADDLLKNYTDTHGRHKKKNKGGWEKSKKKKSGGNNRKQGRAVISPQQRSKGSGSQRTSLPSDSNSNSNSNSNSKRNDERLSLEKTKLQGDIYTDSHVVVAPPKRSKGSSVVSLSNSKQNDELLSLDQTTLDKTTNLQSDADTDIDTTDDGDDIVGLNVARPDDSTSDISSLLSVHDVEGMVSSRSKPEHIPTKVLESPLVVSKDDGETTIEHSAQATAETNNNEEKNKKTLATKEWLTDSETIDSTQITSAATREEEERKKYDMQRKKSEESPTRREAIGTIQDENIERKQAATEGKSSQAEANAIDATTNDLVEGSTIEIASATLEQQNPETISLSESSPTIRISEEQDLLAEESTPDIPMQEKQKPTTDESIHSNDSVLSATADHATASKLNHKISIPPGLPPLPVKAKPVPIAAAGSSSSVSSSSSSSFSKQKNIIVLLIEGMTCGGCVKVVNRVLNSFDEIDSVNTDLKTCKSTLLCNVPRLNLLPILTALDDVGMQAYLQSQSVAPLLPDQSSSVNDASNASAPLPGTAPAKCPLVEQAEKQQTLGAIGARPLLTSELGPFASSVQKPASALSLMDELRVGSTPLRRYQCSCGCEGCICSARQVHKNDNGTDISLTELCNRLETTMGTTKLEETFRKTGGSLELRNKLEEVAFPCGCSDKE